MIFAYPGEEEKDRRESIKLIMDICRRYPGAEFWTNIFTPYPGAPVMEHAFELGIHVPKTFEEWSDFFPRYQVLPWMNGKKHERLQTMREYLRMAFNRVPGFDPSQGPLHPHGARVAGASPRVGGSITMSTDSRSRSG